MSIGGGVVSMPKFPGAHSQRILALPFVSASYGRFFIGADPGAASLGGVGVNLYLDSRWRLATALSAGLSRRKESDDPRLQGLGDVDRTVSFGVGVAYTQDWFTLRTSLLTDMLAAEVAIIPPRPLLPRRRRTRPRSSTARVLKTAASWKGPAVFL